MDAKYYEVIKMPQNGRKFQKMGHKWHEAARNGRKWTKNLALCICFVLSCCFNSVVGASTIL